MGEFVKKSILKIRNIIPEMLLLVVTIGFFCPSSVFISNRDEFKIEYIDILPLIMLVCLIAAIIISMIAIIKMHYRIAIALKAIMFATAVCVYVQFNFLNPNVEMFTGGEVAWYLFEKENFISGLVWGIIFLVVLVLYNLNKNRINEIIKLIAYCGAAMQILTIFLAVIVNDAMDYDLVLTDKGAFELSSKDNVIVFVLDTMDAQYTEDYILSDEAYLNEFKDFTYFSDLVAGGASTVLGMPAVLTGKYMNDTSIDNFSFTKKANSETKWIGELTDNNYEVSIYTDYRYVDGCNQELINNCEKVNGYKISDMFGMFKCLYSVSGYLMEPQFMKQMQKTSTLNVSLFISPKGNKKINEYNTANVAFYKSLTDEGISIIDDKNVFKIYHLDGAHPDYNHDEFMNECENEATPYKVVRGSYNIVIEYMKQLKKLGIYDNCTILITADHGAINLGQNSTLMVKRSHSSQEELIYNDKPVGINNVLNTYVKAALGDDYGYGQNVFEVEGDVTERYHSAIRRLGSVCFPSDDYVNNRSYTKYKITGRSRDMQNVEIVYE